MRPMTSTALRSILAAGLIAFAATGAAAAAYIKYGSIKGESAVTGGKVGDGWILVESWQWSSSRTVQTATGREASAPSVSEISVVRSTDKASTELMKPLAQGSLTVKLPAGQCVVGARHPTATLDTGYMRYEMENVLISSCSTGGGGSGGSQPTEQISLNYEKVSTTYIKQDKQAPKTEVRGWDPKKKN